LGALNPLQIINMNHTNPTRFELEGYKCWWLSCHHDKAVGALENSWSVFSCFSEWGNLNTALQMFWKSRFLALFCAVREGVHRILNWTDGLFCAVQEGVHRLLELDICSKCKGFQAFAKLGLAMFECKLPIDAVDTCLDQ
jgi:hypothetical protein